MPRVTSPARSQPCTCRAQRSEDTVVTLTAARCPVRYSTIISAVNGVVA
ncbi:hypothetical protein [Streptomyces sp. MBT62]